MSRDELLADVTRLEGQVEKLQAFKDYVHKRLDEMGVPVDPESPHKAEGCRIGGRLDYLRDRASAFERVASNYVCLVIDADIAVKMVTYKGEEKYQIMNDGLDKRFDNEELFDDALSAVVWVEKQEKS